jgi:hypothetical protein
MQSVAAIEATKLILACAEIFDFQKMVNWASIVSIVGSKQDLMALG